VAPRAVEAEINYPEDDDIVQVENFGIHFSKEGTVVYGMMVESIQASLGHNGLSVDLLCRVLADVHQDSSEIVDSLLSSYQRKLLDMVYLGDHLSRDKFNVIMCDRARPTAGGHYKARESILRIAVCLQISPLVFAAPTIFLSSRADPCPIHAAGWRAQVTIRTGRMWNVR